MKKKLLALALFSICSASLASEETFDLKGLRLGSSESELHAKTEARCQDEKKYGKADRSCLVFSSRRSAEFETLAGISPSLYSFEYINDQLGKAYVSFHSNHFYTIREALIVKYGKPSYVIQDIVKTKGGATFKNDKAVWKRKGQHIELEKYSFDIEHASLEIASDKFEKEMEIRSTAQAKENAKSL